MSLSLYTAHKSKGTSILKSVSKKNNPNNLSVINFYKLLAGDDNLIPVYVYLSPEERGYPEDQFDNDMKLASTRSNTQAPAIWYGFATSDSDTHKKLFLVLGALDSQ